MTLLETLDLLFSDEITDEDLVAELKDMVSKGANCRSIDIVTCPDGDNLLCLVSKKDYLESAKYLISLGCNINIKGCYGWTPLMNATLCSSLEMVELLLQNGANPNIKNNEGVTALKSACEKGENNLEKIKLLLKYGANPAIRNKYGNTAYSSAKARGYIDIYMILKHAEAYRRVEEHIDIHVKSEEEIEDAVSKLAKRLRGVK